MSDVLCIESRSIPYCQQRECGFFTESEKKKCILHTCFLILFDTPNMYVFVMTPTKCQFQQTNFAKTESTADVFFVNYQLKKIEISMIWTLLTEKKIIHPARIEICVSLNSKTIAHNQKLKHNCRTWNENRFTYIMSSSREPYEQSEFHENYTQHKRESRNTAQIHTSSLLHSDSR